ncbi:hypothetical protein [Cohnella zeiphila]|uniref:DUF948 domain-containing protein n=1 Tax=Cohnella zeiphila TaxID=2761120 RepID=A0A7X0SS98_9BACL|nr:hypothetical protein [Cohnella zeiphila]MBB6735041.1 hypothetical protein [Cohnella zeiphila]
MAWDWAAYSVAAACLAAAAALLIAAVAIGRMLRRWDATLARLERETETTLAQWRRLGSEAADAAERCRRGLEGFERLAEGGRALGAAAEKAAKTAADAVSRWTDRVGDSLAAEEKRTPRHASGPDWAEMGMSLWQALRQRLAGVPNEGEASRDGDADEER